jgi:hypothetical protein
MIKGGVGAALITSHGARGSGAVAMRELCIVTPKTRSHSGVYDMRRFMDVRREPRL